jgi:hypothetical protein
MKSMLSKITAVVLLAILTTTTANSQTLKSIFEHSWKGFSVSKSEEIEGGKLISNQKLMNVVYSDNDNYFTADSFSTLLYFDDKTFSCHTTVTGYVDVNTNEVRLVINNVVSKEELPNGWQWTFDEIHLQLYEDQNDASTYILYGKTYDNDGVMIMEFQLSNR